MSIIAKCGVNFFLTGGTALSRGYYNHRYSDDLDFFVQGDPDFEKQVDEVLSKLSESGFRWDSDIHYIKSPNFTRVMVKNDDFDVSLKLDFVCDTTPHFGDLVKTNVYHRTDSVRNILANKLSAIFRFEAKDVADIREIALHERVDWAAAIKDAREKEAGIDLIYVAQILKGIPQNEFDKIAWIKAVPWQNFKDDIDRIATSMLTLGGTAD